MWETAPSEFDFETLKFRISGLEIKHLEAHNLCDKGVFFFLS